MGQKCSTDSACTTAKPLCEYSAICDGERVKVGTTNAPSMNDGLKIKWVLHGLIKQQIEAGKSGKIVSLYE